MIQYTRVKWDSLLVGENLTKEVKMSHLSSFLDKFGYNWWVGGLVINKDTEFE